MGYTSERNNQIVIQLLKYHGIKKVVASPGATNVSFVASIQQDPYFEIYSSVDERSAVYIACGLAEESGEAVVLSCTGATASRNYFSGLTEAYYRKLPILAITSTMPICRIGHNVPQVIDRTNVTNDIVKLSVHIPIVKDQEDEWNCAVKTNEAILELKHHCPGPVHMNVETLQSGTFDVESIDYVKPIDRIMPTDKFPKVEGCKIAVFVGAHSKWSDALTTAVDQFCDKHNAVVIGDHTSNYKGKYSVPSSLVTNQKFGSDEFKKCDLLIHIGNISGSYLKISPKQVWRVSPDGKVCDTFKTLRYVFEMSEVDFFNKYNEMEDCSSNVSAYKAWRKKYDALKDSIPELPFSNIWVASQLSGRLPENCILHLGILNSLRSWNFFELPESVLVYSNTGGFGIDGCCSTICGTALATDKLVFGVLGDLAFFYDMNVMGNRHVKNNIRILVINNGHGQEFRNYGHRAAQFGEDTDRYIAAAGHFGNKSDTLIKNYVESLGCKYLTAKDKDSFLEQMNLFVADRSDDCPIIFEVFTTNEDESKALQQMLTLSASTSDNAKSIIKNVIGDSGVKSLKKIFKK